MVAPTRTAKPRPNGQQGSISENRTDFPCFPATERENAEQEPPARSLHRGLAMHLFCRDYLPSLSVRSLPGLALLVLAMALTWLPRSEIAAEPKDDPAPASMARSFDGLKSAVT